MLSACHLRRLQPFACVRWFVLNVIPDLTLIEKPGYSPLVVNVLAARYNTAPAHAFLDVRQCLASVLPLGLAATRVRVGQGLLTCSSLFQSFF
jgi:hypothetical protein